MAADGAGGVTAVSIDMLCREIKVDDCDAQHIVALFAHSMTMTQNSNVLNRKKT